MPTVTGRSSITITAVNAVVYEQSPFTFAGQAQASAGQMWRADVSLPPLSYLQAPVWIAWLVSLRGQFGTFLMGNQMCGAPLGSAGGTPLIKGANQTGEDINLDGATGSQTGWLKAGDYCQLGTGSTSRLHQVTADANSDAGGDVTLSLWPHVRLAPADDAALVVSNAVGRWRLSENSQSWTVDNAVKYGISFAAMEAI